ncbi:MAG: hypothetical protein ABIO70_24225 [Pseudomonadota bacterium]
MAVAILVGLTLSLAWLALRHFLGLRAKRRETQPRVPPPDPRTERLRAAGLPIPTRFGVHESPAVNLGGILGPGTPLMGPAPPSVELEPEEHVFRMEEEEEPPEDP